MRNETLHFPYTSTYSSTPHNSNIKHNIYHIYYINIQHTSTLQGSKPHYLQQAPLHIKLYYRRPHRNYNRHTNTQAPYTYIDCHQASSPRGDHKILRTHPPHISSSEEILPRLSRRTLAQLITLNHPFSNHTSTKSTSNHIYHHYPSFVTLTHTTHIISPTSPTYAPRCHPWICGQTPPG